jgi:hypothetical protein
MRMQIRSLCLIFLILLAPGVATRAADTLPTSIANAEYWKMISDMSERGGTFDFEMYMSNEVTFQDVIPELVSRVPQGAAYLGVAPEQNFTYIATLRPRIAFIIDIRRDNMVEMLMYKALFEMSANRTEFLSRLFSRRVVSAQSDPQASVVRLFASLTLGRGDTQFFTQNVQAIKTHLQQTHGFPLTPQDLAAIDKIANAFYRGGPDASLTNYGTSYRLLMSATDPRGKNWNFLASEGNFQFVRQMHQKNLIIPVVGDFSGPKAIRSVARYLVDHGATVGAFYVSNVEEYITSPRSVWSAYCANVATLPVIASSTFIRFGRGGRGSFLGSMPAFVRGGC